MLRAKRRFAKREDEDNVLVAFFRERLCLLYILLCTPTIRLGTVVLRYCVV